MPQFRNVRRVPYPARAMFELVADVEAYPQFVPLCESLHVRERQPRGDGGEVLVADMTVGYQLVRERFTSRVTLQPAQPAILVEYLDGPFRHLENRWRFVPVAEGTSDVDFFISYEFRSLPLQMLMGAMFDRAFRKFSDAFVARAGQVYGRPAPA